MSLRFNPFTGTLDYLGNVSATGVTSLNGQIENSQTFATDEAGTDFAINSLAGVHTFSLPEASATNTGKLTSADWATFNGKQNYRIEKRTITTIEASNKYLVLSTTPADSSLVTMSVVGGTEQNNSVDFALTGQDSGKRVSWNGLGLDGVFAAGDIAIIRYT